MPTKTIIYKAAIANEDKTKKELKLMKKALRRKFKTALTMLDTVTLENQDKILNILFEA